MYNYSCKFLGKRMDCFLRVKLLEIIQVISIQQIIIGNAFIQLLAIAYYQTHLNSLYINKNKSHMTLNQFLLAIVKKLILVLELCKSNSACRCKR